MCAILYSSSSFSFPSSLSLLFSSLFSSPPATYQVSDVNITNQYTDGSVNVQCVFVSGSSTDGCHVIFTDTTNGRSESFNIILPEESKQVSLSTSGNYTVTAYDIVNGSFYGPAVRHSTPVSVVIPTLSPSSTSSLIDTSSKYIKDTLYYNYYH